MNHLKFKKTRLQLLMTVSSLVAGFCLLGDPASAATARHARHAAAEATSVSHVVKHKSNRGNSSRAAKRKRTDSPDARKLFGAQKLPADLPLSSIGTYTNGCLAGASLLPVDGAHYQAMRISRNRFWGHPRTIKYVRDLSDKAHADGWQGTLVGDMGQPRGGPMLTGHASHQIGLDVDLWLTPAPDRKLSDDEREKLDARSGLKVDSAELDPQVWTAAHESFVRDAAQGENVTRVFVTPAIKKALCAKKDPHGADTWWLNRLRPCHSGVCVGHDDHIHVRLSCKPGDKACHNQPAPDAGDGCGSEIDEAMKEVAADPPNKSAARLAAEQAERAKAARHGSGDKAGWEGDHSKVTELEVNPPFPLSKMPAQCKAVLKASSRVPIRGR